MKKCLIIMMLFSMGLASTTLAERGKFKYYRWNVTIGSLQDYQRNLSLTPAPNNTYTVQTGFSFPTSNTAATAYVETPTWANGDNYLARFDGWLLPPITGNYIFWIASDDHSEFRLSTVPESTDLANMQRLCGRNGSATQRNYTANADQKSGEVFLEAGKAYFFYAIWRDGTGGDGCALAWSLPGGGGGPGAIPRWYVTEELPTVIREVSWYPGAVEAEVWNVGGVGGNLQNISTLGPANGFLAIPAFATDYRTFSYNYTFRQRAIIRVPADGMMSFGTSSDDGSRLYIGNWWEEGATLTQVANNDGGHGMRWRSGPIPVEAGLVGITVHHYQGTGGDGLQVGYYSDTIPFQQIPVSALLSRTYASAYSPVMEATNVPPDAVLTWSKPVFNEAATNTVYLAEAGQPLAAVYEGTDSFFDPALQKNKRYVWRVDVAEPNLLDNTTVTRKGPTYSFTTGAPVTITTQPAPAAFDALGGSVTFTIAATCSLPLTYQWYKNGAIIDGETGTELTIDPVEADDLTSYYCVVSNGDPADNKTSSTAWIALKKPVAYYPFDGDASDASGNGNHGTLVTTNTDPTKLPGFVTGVKGQAVQFNGVDQYVDAGTWNPSADSGQLTVSLWARWEPTALTAGDQYQGLIGKRQAWNSTDSYWQIEMSFQNNDRNLPFLNGLARNGASTGTYTGYLRHFQGIDRTEFGTATANSQNAPNEGADRGFDSSRSTKWLGASNAPAWLAYDFKGDEAYVISKYTMTSGNDAAERDPLDWQLQGSNDGGATWTTVDSRTNAATPFSGRQVTIEFTAASPAAYKMYRLYITKINGTQPLVQLADLQLFELVDPAAKWVHVAATYDGVTSKLFINGVQRLSGTGFSLGPKTNAILGIGTCEVHADKTYGNKFMGSIDEVRLYNYALTNAEVAALYAADSASSVCTGNPQFDFNGDCVMDMADLKAFVDAWLQSNMEQ